MKHRTTYLVTCLSLFAIIVAFVGIKFVKATPTDNVSGYAWSSNIGWINHNGTTYGTNIQIITPGTVTGYAWSSNIGWISFNNDATAGCPDGDCVAQVDWDHKDAQGTAYMKGWARACSVFQSGCSGTLADNAYRGDWDGFIKLGTPSHDWGYSVKKDNTIYGYAWGSEVVGWVQMVTGVVLPPDDGPAVTLVANPDTIKKGESSELTATAVNIDGEDACTTSWLPVKMVKQSDGKWISKSTVSPSVTTKYTITCKKGSKTAKADATVTVVGEDLCDDIDGTQTEIPKGHHRGTGAHCPADSADVCDNIAGLQTTIPSGYHRGTGNNCEKDRLDVCGNLAGDQADIPKGLHRGSGDDCDGDGGSDDVCPNIPGKQAARPAGFTVALNGDCVRWDTGDGDACININLIQKAVPAGFAQDTAGRCYPTHDDSCLNIAGYQDVVPVEQTLDDQGNCINIGKKQLIYIEF